MFKTVSRPVFNTSPSHLIASPLCATSQSCLRNLVFDSILCRTSFRKQLGLKQLNARLTTVFHFNETKPKQYDSIFNYVVNDFQTKSHRLQLGSVHWAAEQLANDIKHRGNIKAVILEFIRDLKHLHDGFSGFSGLRGVQIKIVGRLGRKKKQLAQKLVFTAGEVPISTIKAKIAFDQRVLKTKYGSVGLKLWFNFV
jgi:hypothetical protein